MVKVNCLQVRKKQRQHSIVFNWRKRLGKGTLVSAIGFGRTRVAVIAIEKMRKVDYNCKVVVVVSTDNLRTQWENELIKSGLHRHSKVVTAGTSYEECDKTDLLILDSIHLFDVKEFNNVFKSIQYTKVLGFTSMLAEGSRIHALVDKYCPVFEKITLEECNTKGWVSDYVVYNLAVPLTLAEEGEHNRRDNLCIFYERLFGRDTGLREAIKAFIHGSGTKKRQAEILWRSLKGRKKVLQSAHYKLDVTQSIVETFRGRHAMIFSNSTTFATHIERRLTGICTLFLSHMRESEQKLALRRYRDPRTNVRAISLNSAMNFDEVLAYCDILIITSDSSSPANTKQRMQRVMKSDAGKKGIVVNLYVPETQEVKWLNRRQRGTVPIWINDISEIK